MFVRRRACRFHCADKEGRGGIYNFVKRWPDFAGGAFAGVPTSEQFFDASGSNLSSTRRDAARRQTERLDADAAEIAG